MAKPRRAQKIRKADDFSGLVTKLFLQRRPSNMPVFSWTLEEIKRARDAQLRGDFHLASKLADSSRTDDAIFVAYGNRIAPHRAIGVAIKPADESRKALSIAAEAEALFGQKGIGLTLDALLNAGGCFVNHGVAFLRITPQVRDDGSRIDFFVSYWPIEHVRWDERRRCYVTNAETESGALIHEVEIRHGDGEWIIIADREHEPWKYGAILSIALIWGRHAFANADWARGSRSHGNAKVIGELPENVPLQDDEGNLTPEAVAFLEILRDLVTEDSPAGIRPPGSKIEVMTNNSTAWQVWKELATDAAKGAARVYLGTDGVLGAAGGAPGVDITALFGVAATLVQGDLETIERCLTTGLLEPWCALNFGDSTLAPSRSYLIPRPEEQNKILSMSEREKAFYATVKSARDSGFEITNEWIAETAKRYDVKAPMLPLAAAKAPTVPLAPTDVIEYLTPNQVLATVGIPRDETDPDGDTPIRILRAREEAAKAAASNAGSLPNA